LIFRTYGGSSSRRAAGGVEYRQAELPVLAPVADALRQAFRIGMLAEAPLPLLV
jgi:hypothetical protein